MTYIQACVTLLSSLCSTQTIYDEQMIWPEKERDFSGVGFTKKELPQSVVRANLTNANLTGQYFTHTNFEGTQLEGAILTHTTCDYRKCFQDNMKANMSRIGQWYPRNLPQDVESITQVYPTILQDRYKAELLQIASGLAYLPYYEYMEFDIKIKYWSCKLLRLKKQLSSPLGDQLVCSLADVLEYDAEKYCWKTDYPFHLEHSKGKQIADAWCIASTGTYLVEEIGTLIQYYLTERSRTRHANFDHYLQLFQEGLVQYKVESETKLGYDLYKGSIKKNIQGLQKTYLKLTSEELRKEAIDIACELSTFYKYQGLPFLFRYISCQNRLIQLKISAGKEVGKNIYYNDILN